MPSLGICLAKSHKTVIAASWEPVEYSNYLPDSTQNLFTKGNTMATVQDTLFCLGTMMLMAGGIAALGLLSRGHLVESRLKEREPLRLSVCS